MPTPLTGV